MGRLTDGFSYCLVQFSWILLVFGEFGNSYYIASGSCGVAPLKNAAVGRIVNGSISAAGSWPWQVLVMENGAQSCGGSLISEDWIMTAAHCIVGDITAHTFYVGAHYIDVSGSNAQEVKAHLHICHSDYNDRTFENDICVIKLTERVNFNDYIVPVCLPQSGTIIADGERVIVTGWGDTEGTGSNNELREAEVVVLNRADCSAWYGNDDIIIPENHFCAGYQQGQTDTCRGDSGGPLVHEETESGITAYVLRGMTSFGVRCAVAQRPGAYVTVAGYINWIDQKMAQVSGDSCQPVQSGECGRDLIQSGTIRSPAILPNYAYPSPLPDVSCRPTLHSKLYTKLPNDVRRGLHTHAAAFLDTFADRCGMAPLKNAAVGRIVNGDVSAAGSWPWQVLIMKDGVQICGGSLISEFWVLTAAHCIESNVTAYRFFVGAHYIDVSGDNAQEVKAHLFIRHPDYNDRTVANDICLIKLSKNVAFNNYIAPICLPERGTTIADDEKVIVTGWGKTEGTGSNIELRQAEVYVLNRDNCSAWYKKKNISIPEGHFCAGHQSGRKDTCSGDSGGPLVHEETKLGVTAYVLRGVTSFGSECAKPERPGVYVTVAYYISWIDHKMEVISGDSCQPHLSQQCGGDLRQSGTIRSPSYLPNFVYPSNTTCSWNIDAPTESWITFTFICYFRLSFKTDCDDFVVIVSTEASKKFCGNQLPDPYLVKTSSATLTFSTNRNFEYPGFVVEVEFIDQTTEAVIVTTEALDTEITSTTISVICLILCLVSAFIIFCCPFCRHRCSRVITFLLSFVFHHV